MLAAVTATLLAGCTDGAETPTTTTVPSASASPTPSPTPSPIPDAASLPDQPEAMSRADLEGATAVARYFLELYAYIYATGDTAAWRELTAETCEFCLESATDAEQLVASGKRGGTPMEVVSAEATELKPGVWFSVQTRVVQPPTIETDASGEQTQTSDGGTYDLDFALTWADRWIVDSVGVVPVP